MPASSGDRIPITLLTGFLGSGKTTLLNSLLASPELHDSAVIVNEFGDVGIDHLLVRGGDGVMLLDSGCLCCAVNGSLADTLMDLLNLSRAGTVPPFRRVLIELSGLADPAPVADLIFHDRSIAPRFVLERVVATVDAVFGVRTLTDHIEAAEQVALADLILLTKTDRADADEAGARAAIRRLNALVPVIVAPHGMVDPAEILGAGSRIVAPPATHGEGHRHAPHSVAMTHRIDRPINWSGIAAFTELAPRIWRDGILRCKGLLSVDREPGPVLLQGVRTIFHTDRLSDWPDADRSSRLVCIFRTRPDDFARTMALLDAEAGTMPPASLVGFRR